MVKKAELPKHIVTRTLELAAERGWARLTLGEIAEGSGVSLAQLRELYPSKASIIAAFVEQTDLAVLKGGDYADADTMRDRLFDVLMRRFDAMKPHRDGLAAVWRDSCGSLASVLCGGARLMRSMRWMLEAAGCGTGGLSGRLKVKGLAAVYLSVLGVWLRDDSDDMARTMATLDRRLNSADSIAARLFGRRRRPSADDAAEQPEPA